MTDNTARNLNTDLPDLKAYWMPFTGNRYFKENPRIISRAEGMYCYTHDGKSSWMSFHVCGVVMRDIVIQKLLKPYKSKPKHSIMQWLFKSGIRKYLN